MNYIFLLFMMFFVNPQNSYSSHYNIKKPSPQANKKKSLYQTTIKKIKEYWKPIAAFLLTSAGAAYLHNTLDKNNFTADNQINHAVSSLKNQQNYSTQFLNTQTEKQILFPTSLVDSEVKNHSEVEKLFNKNNNNLKDTFNLYAKNYSVHNLANTTFNKEIQDDYYKNSFYRALQENDKKINQLQNLKNIISNNKQADTFLMSFATIYHEVGHLLLALFDNNFAYKKKQPKIILPSKFYFSDQAENYLIIPSSYKNAGGKLQNIFIGLSDYTKEITTTAAGYISQDILHKIFTNNSSITNKEQLICDKNQSSDYPIVLKEMATNKSTIKKINQTIDKTSDILINLQPAHLLYSYYIWNNDNIDESGKLPKIIIKSMQDENSIKQKYNILPKQNIDIIMPKNKKQAPSNYETKKEALINVSFNPFVNLEDFEHLVDVSKKIIAHNEKHYRTLTIQQKQVLDLVKKTLIEEKLNQSRHFIEKNSNKKIIKKKLKKIEEQLLAKNAVTQDNLTENRNKHDTLRKQFNTLLNALSEKKKQSLYIKNLQQEFDDYEVSIIFTEIKKQFNIINDINSNRLKYNKKIINNIKTLLNDYQKRVDILLHKYNNSYDDIRYNDTQKSNKKQIQDNLLLLKDSINNVKYNLQVIINNH